MEGDGGGATMERRSTSTSTSTVLSTMIALSHHYRRTYVLDGDGVDCDGAGAASAAIETDDAVDGGEKSFRLGAGDRGGSGSGGDGIHPSDEAAPPPPIERAGRGEASGGADAQHQPRPIPQSTHDPTHRHHPPIVHAMGGSVGSALALLLLYPLERARIEMMRDRCQCRAEAQREGGRGAAGDAGRSSPAAPPPDREDSHHSASSFAAVAAAVGGDDDDDDDGDRPPGGAGGGRGTPPSPSSSPSSSSCSSPSPSPGSQSSTSSAPSSFVVLSEGGGGGSGSRSGSPTSTSSSSSSSGVRVEVEDGGERAGGGGEAGAGSEPTPLDGPRSAAGRDGAEGSSGWATTTPARAIPRVDAAAAAAASDEGPSRPASPSTTSDADATSPQSSSTTTDSNTNLYRCLLSLYKRGELYHGALPVTLTMAISNFVYFYAHEVAKGLLLAGGDGGGNGRGGRDSIVKNTRWWRSLVASTLAGVVNVLLTNPLWVANMRIIESGRRDRRGENGEPAPAPAPGGRSAGLFSTLVRIARHGDGDGEGGGGAGGGIRALWGGTVASLLLVSNPSIQHFVYDTCRAGMLSSSSSSSDGRGGRGGRSSSATLTPPRAFLLGAFSKAVATVVTYPLQLAQVLLRAQRRRGDGFDGDDGDGDCGDRRRITEGRGEDEDDDDEDRGSPPTTSPASADPPPGPHRRRQFRRRPRRYGGTLDCLRSLYAEGGGIAALYAGIDAKLTQTVLTAAFTFLTYERVLSWVGGGYHRYYHDNNHNLSILPSPSPQRRRRGLGR